MLASSPAFLLTLFLACSGGTSDTGSTDTNASNDSGADPNSDTSTASAVFDYGGAALQVRSAHAAFSTSGGQLNVKLSTSENLCTYESGGYPGTDCDQNCAFLSAHTGDDALLTASINIPLDAEQKASLEAGGSLDLDVTGSLGVWNTTLADVSTEDCVADCDSTWDRKEGDVALVGLSFPSTGLVSVSVDADFGFEGAVRGDVVTTACAGM